MGLLCTLSGHDAAPVDLENQGFRFSRCRRCHADLIRSAASPAYSWRRVPPGLRVAWRNTDVSPFGYATLADRARHAVGAARDMACLAAAVAGWHWNEARRRLHDRYRRAATVLRQPRLARPRRQWIVVVSLPPGRDIRLQRGDALIDA